MRRDPDLIRAILRELEDCPEPTWPGAGPMAIEGHSRVKVAYHVKLLHEAGYLAAVDATDSDGLDWRPVALTNLGHEFVGKSRRESTWKRAKNVVLERTGGFALDVMMKVLTDLVVG
jgi:hypothetical protein